MTPGAAQKPISRRSFLTQTAAAAAAAAGAAPLVRAGQKSLRVAHWRHFLPGYNQWFTEGFAREWGRQHDTNVVVDTIPVDQIRSVAAQEVAAGSGHDVFVFPWPPAELRDHAIDHTEVYQMVAARHGNVNRLGHRSTFDPRAKRYFALADSWMPAPFLYFQDSWGEIGMPLGPVHYDGLRSGARKLRARPGVPCGLALAPTLEGNVTLHTLLNAFRAQVFDEEGNVLINRGYRTIEALKYARALYQEAGTPEELTWSGAGNARAMLARKVSCTANAISVLRTAETELPDTARQILLSPPLLGPAGVMALPHVTNCSVVLKYSGNQQGAKQFLTDFVDSFRIAYEKSSGCNFPVFQSTVPDLVVRLQKDPADPPLKYTRLKDALHWTPNLGFPGFATPAAMEVFHASVVPRMFASVVRGDLSPEDAARTAENEVKGIAEKWRGGGA